MRETYTLIALSIQIPLLIFVGIYGIYLRCKRKKDEHVDGNWPKRFKCIKWNYVNHGRYSFREGLVYEIHKHGKTFSISTENNMLGFNKKHLSKYFKEIEAMKTKKDKFEIFTEILKINAEKSQYGMAVSYGKLNDMIKLANIIYTYWDDNKSLYANVTEYVDN